MQELLGKYKHHSKNNLDKVDEPSLDLQLQESDEIRMGKELFDKNQELSHLHGEDLQGLALEELQRLETLLERGLHRVRRTKLINLNSNGKRPRTECDNLVINAEDQGQSSDSVICSCNSGPPPEDDCSDTSLRLA
ncbi:putative transcription factor, K-box [Helianthus annuus]|nr:putative transcription factor, K-box [Helianthus annuus]KAJ0698777.1 putative transcription factor, K-box [Helianthus annuus]